MTRLFKICFIVLILIISSFISFGGIVRNVEAGSYTSPDTGVNWTMKQLAVNSSGTVTSSGSVYYVKDMLTISPKDTLVIVPGSIIKVDKDVRIDIKGRLYCVGNNSSPIKITSNAPSPKAGDWLAIRLNQAKANSIIEYTTIEYAYDGLYIYQCKPMIRNNIIRNIAFRGVFCFEDTANVINNTLYKIHNPVSTSLDEGSGVRTFSSLAYIANNTIYDVQKFGMKLDYSNCTVYGNNISQSRYGINIYRSEPHILNNYVWNNSQGIVMWENIYVEIGGNLVEDNIELGIYIHKSSPDIHHNTIKSSGIGIKNYYQYDGVTIRNNEISMNEVSGINFDQFSNVVIENNFIWHNFYEPIYCTNVDDLVIRNNTIQRNEDDGIELVDCKRVTIDNNFIDDNRGGNGIHLESTTKANIKKNTIKDAGFHAVKFESSTISSMYDNIIMASHQKDIWLEKTEFAAVNLTFDRAKVKLSSDSKFLHKNFLNVKVQDNYQYPIMGATVTIKDDSKTVLNQQTNSYGRINDILLTDLIYDKSSSFKDNVTEISVKYSDFVFDNNPRVVNMSAPHTEVFGRNRLPEIHITKPDNKQEVVGSIYINGTAFDPDGLIQTVEVSINDGKWQTTTAMGLYWSKWSYQWNTTDVGDGEYLISARVYDGMNYTYDSVIVIVDNIPGGNEPVVFIVVYSPVEEQQVRGHFVVFGTAFSSLGNIISVEIKIDNGSYELATPGERVIKKYNPETGLYEDVVIPDWNTWGYTWNTTKYEDGPHKVYARVRDDLENVDVEIIDVIVDNRKTDANMTILEITHPSDSEEVSKEIEISGKFWSYSNSIPSIKMKIGNGNWFIPDVFQWYDWWLFNSVWDTSEYYDGIYEIAVKGKIDQEELVDRIIVVVNNGGNKSSFGVRITNPLDAEIINGTYTVSGYCWNYDYDILGIEIRVDTHPWQEVTEYDQKHISSNDEDPESEPESPFKLNWIDWSHELDTRPYKEGIHVITVKAEDAASTVFSYVTVIFINKEYTPDEIDPEQTEEILGIKITHPDNGAIVIGSVEIQGLAWSRFENITSVEIQIDELGYIPAQATDDDWTVWGYIWDTTIHKNGIHKISARMNAVVDEKTLTMETTVLVIINNAVEGPGQAPIADIEVIIWTPKENETVSGVIEVFGFGWVSNNGTIQEIQIKIDNEPWLRVNPIHSDWWTWNYSLNTSEYENGKHKLTARLNTGKVLVNSSIEFNINNTGKSAISDDPVTPDNGDGDEGSDYLPSFLPEKFDASVINILILAIIIILMILIIIYISIFRLKRKISTKDKDFKDDLGKDKKKEKKEKDKEPEISKEEPKEVSSDLDEDLDDERVEVDSELFEEEDDEIIVIRGEMIIPSTKAAKVKPEKAAAAEATPIEPSSDDLETLPKTKPVDEEKKGIGLVFGRKKADKSGKGKGKGRKGKGKDKGKKTGIPLATEVEEVESDEIPAATATPVAEPVDSEGDEKKKEKTSAKKSETDKKTKSVEEKLELLKKKFEDGQITEAHYEKLKANIESKGGKEDTKPLQAISIDTSKKPPMNCKKCEKPPVYLKEYRAWYCTDCKEYVAREIVKS
ncbi:MAG: right-handed parallel beta-helix repeat-containing protein [Thermoplasmata archaeon]|nr:MAG: right-handed parallel beta-helix repeat-containing protein [Thermoplasmata archaeon]